MKNVGCRGAFFLLLVNIFMSGALNTEDYQVLDLMHSRSKDSYLLGNSDAGRIYKYILKTDDPKLKGAAEYELGLLYEKGKGVPQNDAEAIRWWSKAAKNGFVDAQYSLAVMHHTGFRKCILATLRSLKLN
jgi:TPR repeat protein